MAAPNFKKAILDQIDDVLEQHRKLTQQTTSPSPGISPDLALPLANTMAETIRQLSPPNSIHLKRIQDISSHNLHSGQLPNLVAILQSLKEMYEKDYLRSITGRIQENLFSDLLEMAEYFLAENYKDPAAVIAGSVLEQHLRKLCSNANPQIPITDAKGYRKAQILNQDLRSAGIYSLNHQQQVTAWLGLRNEAAHNNKNNNTESQIGMMVRGIRDFLSRNPA